MTDNKIEKFVEHPLESLFGIDEGSTVIEKHEVNDVAEPCDLYDNKDSEIEQQIQAVHNAAMETYENLVDMIDNTDLEPKYAVMQMGVAGDFLKTALAAAKEKAKLKSDKDKLVSREKRATTKASATSATAGITMDHTSLLKLLNKEKPDEEIIEGEYDE